MVESAVLLLELGNLLTLATIVIALNLMAGYAGIPNFGLTVFVYLGAFTAGAIGARLALVLIYALDADLFAKLASKHGGASELILWEIMSPTVNRELVPRLSETIGESLALSLTLLLILLAAAAAIGAIFGALSSFAAARLREDYLAIALLAFSEMMVQVVFAQTDWLAGGRYAIYVPSPFAEEVLDLASLVPVAAEPRLRVGLLLAILLAAATLMYAERIANSPMGRALRAMRDDDLALSSYGRDISAMRIRVMMIGGAIAALAGLIYAISFQPVVKASDYTRMSWTFVPWAMMILGGMANNWGVVLGAATLYVGRKAVEIFVPMAFDALPLGVSGTSVDIVRAVAPNIFVGLVILAVLYLRPEGILPERPKIIVGRRALESIRERLRSLRPSSART